MTWLQFISSIIGSVSWPAAIVILVLIMRKPLTTIILSLRKASVKDFAFECWPPLQSRNRSFLTEKLLDSAVFKTLHEDHLTVQEQQLVEGLQKGMGENTAIFIIVKPNNQPSDKP